MRRRLYRSFQQRQCTSIQRPKKTIIEGPRDTKTNLWLMPLKNNNNNNNNNIKPIKRPFVIQLKHTANSAYQQKSVSYLQAWRHTTLGVLVVTILIRAMNKN